MRGTDDMLMWASVHETHALPCGTNIMCVVCVLGGRKRQRQIRKQTQRTRRENDSTHRKCCTSSERKPTESDAFDFDVTRCCRRSIECKRLTLSKFARVSRSKLRRFRTRSDLPFAFARPW